MRSVSTFGAFTAARLGILAAQKGLDVTGHNISNINTAGYTRQVLDQISLRTGGNDRYQSIYDTNVGSGVLCTGVSQLRDPYLDIRYRNEQASVGAMDAKLSALEELSTILDEVGKGNGDGVIEKQFNDLVTQLQNLSKNAGLQEFDTLVRSSAETLVQLFNTYAKKLETIQENQSASLTQDVQTVNGILNNIRDLNESIRASQIHGDKALELRDQRNLLLDELSKYVKIDVTYGTEKIGEGTEIEKLVIKLAGNRQNNATEKATLVDGIYATQLSVSDKMLSLNPKYNKDDPTSGKYLKADGTATDLPEEAALVDNTNYNLELSALKDSMNRTMAGSVDVKLGDNDLYGSIQSTREMLTEKGEFSTAAEAALDKDATTKRGIPYYKNSLDVLAKKFAEVLNDANTGHQVDADGFYVDTNGARLESPVGVQMNQKDADKLTDEQKKFIKDNGVSMGGALFSNSGMGNDTDDINAKNISISKNWATGSTRIVSSMKYGAGSQENDNIVHIITLMDKKHAYQPSDASGSGWTPDATGNESFFTGSFQEMLVNITGTLGNDKKVTTTLLQNYATSATELSTSRDGVSGVDLNDEAVSMMQYQKSYSAACRLMTTLDEALDKLINGTGVVGR